MSNKYAAYSRILYYCEGNTIYPYLYLQLQNGWRYEAFYNDFRVYRSESMYREKSYSSWSHVSTGSRQTCMKFGSDLYNIASYIQVATNKPHDSQMVELRMKDHLFDERSVYIDSGRVFDINKSSDITTEPTANHYGYTYTLPIRRKDFVLDLSIYFKFKKLRDFIMNGDVVLYKEQEPISLYDFYVIEFDWFRNKVTAREESIIHNFDSSYPEKDKELILEKTFGNDRREGIDAYFNTVQRLSLESPDLLVELTL